MEKLAHRLGDIFGRGRVFKLMFNLFPGFRRTGARMIEASDDFHYTKIKLPLNYKTRNYVGTIYGGSIYSCVDGIYMVQLINILGKHYVVWDKRASIRFRRPGNTTLFAEFLITKEFISQIKSEIQELREKDYVLKVDLVDSEGKVYAEVEKVLYISTKEHYKEKRRVKKLAGKI
ncbi:protein of unknown function [Reichenbachiella faecimaris]|uniref:Acyl-coenzyme A thioesterase PaaI, contains HGG motif n=1 Tax=Reichenbachiella faecimaris TaxID=692418 RepID=A0A1W2GKA6_REIFA|nr:DUF4442 domain-containing protein [Reichenbachiella faecimaris]SMD37103.1 protein of unknown function [Reichenbachiella faecimaris]